MVAEYIKGKSQSLFSVKKTIKKTTKLGKEHADVADVINKSKIKLVNFWFGSCDAVFRRRRK